MTKQEFYEITTWLYFNHEAHRSAKYWRQAFIKKLNSMLNSKDKIDYVEKEMKKGLLPF